MNNRAEPLFNTSVTMCGSSHLSLMDDCEYKDCYGPTIEQQIQNISLASLTLSTIDSLLTRRIPPFPV
jgi:hypothetical protein